MSEPLDLPTIFEQARALFGAERDRYLESMCGGNEDLRREIESLIAASDPAHDEDHFSEPDPLPGRQISGFHVIRLLGEGGHGRVYLARQQNPERDVALKIMAGGLLSRSARRRFEYESELLARLRHPGIAHVYEAGVETIGGVPLPWFAMEHIEGARTIVEYVRETHVSMRDRVRLAIELCEVLQYGHQNGVLHRDLKPSNILVGNDGRPKVIDFGVAGSLGGDRLPLTLATQAGDILGTLAYMSPEQCGGDARTADARADTYALGAVIYEMFTHAPAFDLSTKTIPDAIQTVIGGMPKLPSSFDAQLRGDLDAIVMKSLEREPARRYQSAADFALDLQAYLDGLPVRARKQTWLYRSERFVRRNWIAIGSLTLVITLLLSATVVSLRALDRERAARLAEETRSGELADALVRVEEEVRTRKAALDFLGKQVIGAVPSRSGKADVTIREALLSAVARIPEIVKGDARAEVELRRYAVAALVGLNELKAACAEYARVIELVDASNAQTNAQMNAAASSVPLLTPESFVELLGAYGFVLSSTGDPSAAEIQERALNEARRTLGEDHVLTIQAGTRRLSGRVKADGFASVREDALALLERATRVLGVADVRVSLLRQLVVRGMMYGDASDRARALMLMQVELDACDRTPEGKPPEMTRALELEVLTARGDPRAIEVGRRLVEETAAVFEPSTPRALTRRASLLRALCHHGVWDEAMPIAQTQIEGERSAPTATAAGRMDSFLALAVIAAEKGDRGAAAQALEAADEALREVPETSARRGVAELDRLRVQAILAGALASSGDSKLRASAADFAVRLRAAIDAVVDMRPLSQSAKLEARAVLARLLASAGRAEDAAAEARGYLETLQSSGLLPGWHASNMERLLKGEA
jgi:serine/threonine protein kinase